jgi:hypothetical protein
MALDGLGEHVVVGTAPYIELVVTKASAQLGRPDEVREQDRART